MKTRFAQPILGCCVIIELAVIGIGRFVSIEAFQSAIIGEVYFVVLVDRDCTRPYGLVGKASVVKIRQGCSEAVSPGQTYLPTFRFVKALESLGLFFEERFEGGLGSRGE